MDLLPLDLKKLIGIHLPYGQIGSYSLEFNLQTKEFLLNHLVNFFQFPKNFLAELWGYPEHFYDLDSYDRYVRVLTYFGYSLPGSEKFLSLKKCYDYSLKKFDSSVASYFGEKLGYSSKKIKTEITQSMSEVGRFFQGRKSNPYFKEIKKGKYPSKITGKKSAEDCIIIAIINHQYTIAEEIAENHNISAKKMEKLLFIAYTVIGNLSELQELFKVDSNLNICNLLITIYQIIPKIDPQILQWLASKINFHSSYNGELTAWFYLIAPEKITLDNAIAISYSYNQLIKVYIAFKLYPTEKVLSRDKEYIVMYNLEYYNILITNLLQNPDQKISGISFKQIAQNIENEIKDISK